MKVNLDIDRGRIYTAVRPSLTVIEIRLARYFEIYTAGVAEGLYSWFYWKEDYKGWVFIVELNSYLAELFVQRVNRIEADPVRPTVLDPRLVFSVVTSDLAVEYPGLAGVWTAVRVEEMSRD